MADDLLTKWLKEYLVNFIFRHAKFTIGVTGLSRSKLIMHPSRSYYGVTKHKPLGVTHRANRFTAVVMKRRRTRHANQDVISVSAAAGKWIFRIGATSRPAQNREGGYCKGRPLYRYP